MYGNEHNNDTYLNNLTIRRKNLPNLLDISSSTLDGFLNPKSPYYLPDFPPSILLGTRTRVWLVQDIIAYLKRNRQITPSIGDSPQDPH